MLLFATEGRHHQTVLNFAENLKAHAGDPAELRSEPGVMALWAEQNAKSPPPTEVSARALS